MDTTGAYGAGRSTGQFDVMAFIQKPQVILRSLALLFAIIVFGCISSQGYFEESECLYGSQGACSFGIAIGVIAFLALVILLCIDGLFANISSVQQRKHIVMADLGFSGFWTLMWFVCFCYLWSAWNSSDVREKALKTISANGVQAAIAFSFFSIPCFAGLTFLAYRSFKSGVNEDFAQTSAAANQNYADFSAPQSQDPYQNSSGGAGEGQQGQTGQPFQGDY